MTTQQERARRGLSAKSWADEPDRVFEPTSIRIPDGVHLWKPKEGGIYRLDPIPYIAGKYNRRADEGMEHFELSYEVHGGLGPRGFSKYCCNTACFKQPCYFCDVLARKKGGDQDPEFLKKLARQSRMLMRVLDVTSQESRSLGWQILDQAYGSSKHPYFGYLLKNKIRTLPQKYEFFSDLQDGLTLLVQMEEATLNGRGFLKPVNIEMIERKKKYNQDLLNKGPKLDDLLVFTPYAKQEEVFNQVPDSDNDNGGEVGENNDFSGDGFRRTAQVERIRGRDVDMDDDDDEDDDDDDGFTSSDDAVVDEEEPTPKKRGRPSKVRKVEVEEEEDPLAGFDG